MSLKGFRYLRKRRILTLFTMIILSSMLFSITAFSLTGFHSNFNAMLGRGEDIVVIYDSKSRTPYTGYVAAYLAERISLKEGVLASSSEMIIPCLIKDESIFLRGIIPEEFTKLNQINMLDGDMLEINDLNSIIVGKALAERLNLKTGENVLILGVLGERYLELQVKGIYESHTTMDDEALAPLYVGQWLRGANYNLVTLIRFKIDRNKISPSMILDEVAKEASEPSPSQGEGQAIPSIIPSGITSIALEKIGVQEAQKFMSSYLERYGATWETFLILSVMVFIFSSASIATASKTIITQHKGEMEILRSLGASRNTLKKDLLIKLLPWSLAASTLGAVIAIATLAILHETNKILILSHRIPLQIDPIILITNYLLGITLVSITILRTDLKSTRA